MIKEIGHTAETEEILEDTANHLTGTGRLGDLLDILVKEETDLEKEANLHLEVTGITATLEVTGTSASPEVTGTAVTLETDPDMEEGETVGEVTVERLSMTTSLILGKLSGIKLLKKI